MVSFDLIQIREYSITLGDHPDCEQGPPLTIGWDYHKEVIWSVDEYEKKMTTTTTNQHNISNNADVHVHVHAHGVRKLSPQDRCQLLKEAGISDRNVQRAIREVKKVRQQREEANRSRLFLTAGQVLAMEKLLQTDQQQKQQQHKEEKKAQGDNNGSRGKKFPQKRMIRVPPVLPDQIFKMGVREGHRCRHDDDHNDHNFLVQKWNATTPNDNNTSNPVAKSVRDALHSWREAVHNLKANMNADIGGVGGTSRLTPRAA